MRNPKKPREVENEVGDSLRICSEAVATAAYAARRGRAARTLCGSPRRAAPRREGCPGEESGICSSWLRPPPEEAADLLREPLPRGAREVARIRRLGLTSLRDDAHACLDIALRSLTECRPDTRCSIGLMASPLQASALEQGARIEVQWLLSDRSFGWFPGKIASWTSPGGLPMVLYDHPRSSCARRAMGPVPTSSWGPRATRSSR